MSTGNVIQRGAAALSALALVAAFPATADTQVASLAGAGQIAMPETRSAGGVVDDLNAGLLDVMRNADRLGASGRFEKLRPIVASVFDVPLMTRVAVGQGWTGLNEGQRAHLTDAFSRFIAATYARRFDGYDGERFRIEGEQASGARTLVRTSLVKSDGEAIALDYLVAAHDGRWQVEDVYLTGTISELATRRSEFAAVFAQAGYEGLLASLEQKVAGL